jgi:hypothetical protein
MEHTHDEHNHVHLHSHSDDHIHEHSHGAGHVHSHPHDEAHTHSEGTNSLNETKALLSYMLHHNEHHAEELAALLDSLPKNAQKKLTLAIGSFEAANVQLQKVLDCLE